MLQSKVNRMDGDADEDGDVGSRWTKEHGRADVEMVHIYG